MRNVRGNEADMNYCRLELVCAEKYLSKMPGNFDGKIFAIEKLLRKFMPTAITI